MDTIEILSPKEIHQWAIDKGWWDSPRELPELLCLLHSEISEALEAYRNNIPDGEKHCVAEELADLVVRLWDMCGAMNIDIVSEVAKKHAENLQRPYRHGNKRC